MFKVERHSLSEENETSSLPLNKTKQIVKERPQSYKAVDDNARRRLLELITVRKESIKTAASKLGINYSTAKSVLNTFRNQGRIDKKRFRSKRGLKCSEEPREPFDLPGESPLGCSADLESMKSITMTYASRDEEKPDSQYLSSDEKDRLHVFVHG